MGFALSNFGILVLSTTLFYPFFLIIAITFAWNKAHFLKIVSDSMAKCAIITVLFAVYSKTERPTNWLTDWLTGSPSVCCLLFVCGPLQHLSTLKFKSFDTLGAQLADANNIRLDTKRLLQQTHTETQRHSLEANRLPTGGALKGSGHGVSPLKVKRDPADPGGLLRCVYSRPVARNAKNGNFHIKLMRSRQTYKHPTTARVKVRLWRFFSASDCPDCFLTALRQKKILRMRTGSLILIKCLPFALLYHNEEHFALQRFNEYRNVKKNFLMCRV